MHSSWLLMTLLLLIPSTSSQNSTTIIDPSILVTIQFDFDYTSDKIDTFAAHTIFTNAQLYDITVDDLVNLTHLSQIDLSTFTELLDRFNVTLEDVPVFDVLKSLNISVFSTYQSIRSGFYQDVRNDERKVLEIFGIESGEFNTVLLYGDDGDLRRVLQTGNFSRDNVERAFQAISKTPESLFEYVKPIWLSDLRTLDMRTLLAVLHQYNITEKHLGLILNSLGVLPGDYHQSPAFSKAISDLVDSANSEPILGVAINATSVVTAANVLTKFRPLRDYLDVFLDASSAVHQVDRMHSYDRECAYGPVVLSGPSYSAERSLEASEGAATGCVYVTLLGGEVLRVEVEVVGTPRNVHVVEMSNGTVFVLGSPLVCEGRVYAVAEQRQGTKIGFRTLDCYAETSDYTTIFPSGGGRVAAALGVVLGAVLVGLLSG